jgi:hypothetical protein
VQKLNGMPETSFSLSFRHAIFGLGKAAQNIHVIEISNGAEMLFRVEGHAGRV